MSQHKSVFAPAAPSDRALAFEEYWSYLVARDGAIEETIQSLEHKTGYHRSIQAHPVHAEEPLTSARNIDEVARSLANQDLGRADKRLLALTVIYKFVSHEASGIQAAWASSASWAECRTLRQKITRYHLCEEFCHLRLFAEMFKVFSLGVEWAPLSWPARVAYVVFCRFPGWLLSPPAFCSELMGIVFYRHIRRVLQDVFADEPKALVRLSELLGEIMVYELGHVGERRSYLGNTGITLAQALLPVMVRRFFNAIPEARVILDVNRMVQEALEFDYSGIDSAIIQRAWIPAYCQA